MNIMLVVCPCNSCQLLSALEVVESPILGSFLADLDILEL